MHSKVIFAVFVIILQRKCSARQTSPEFKKVFLDLANSLTKREHTVTVFRFKTPKEKTDPVFFTSIAAIPHIVAVIPSKPFKFELKTNAIVSLNSVASYEVFERNVLRSQVSSMVNQVIYFLHSETTFDDLRKISES